MKDIFIGAAYYPEMWDEAEVNKDIARCKELGINCLRVGEFAWGKMEPEEGKFVFSWLENVVNKLYENGIYTVMRTPTCTPPRWMLDKYTQMRRVTPDNQRQNVSSRCHVCKSSYVAREKNALIVEEMAKVFAGNKGIIGWQIDNELYPYQDGCFCENCKKGFRKYLKDKFGAPEKLNKTWGMTRWSLEYNSFDDVQPPYPDEWRHPSLRKAWWDYQCGLICSYVDEQAEILRKYGCKNIGTDMMPNDLLDYYAVNKKLYVVQYNHYDTADRLYTNAFAYDFLRCVKDKPFWVTETQVGWNGSEYADNGYRPERNCYANTLLPFVKGAEMNLYWLFRAHPNGHELGHGALFSSAGRSYRVTEEVKKAVDDLKKCEKFLTETKIESKIALHFSSTSAINFKVAPLVKNFDYRQTIIDKYHKALRHYNVDVIDTPHGLDDYEVVISPFLSTADENDFKARIIDWVYNGGIWIVGPMTDIMDGNVSKYTDAPYGFLEELAGVYTKYQKPIDNDVFKAKWSDGETCSVGGCFDAYERKEGTKSLATYSECEFAPLSVITERMVGKGKVILTGSVVSEKDLLKLVNRKPIAEASSNIVLVERCGGSYGIIAVEIENKDGYIVLDGDYNDLISGKRFCGRVDITPYEVFVFVKIKMGA